MEPAERTFVAPGVVVKVEEEETRGPRNGQNPATTTGRVRIKREIKAEHGEEMAIQRPPKSKSRRSVPANKTGHRNMKPETEIKLEEEEARGPVMADQRYDERDRSPPASPDYFMVQVKEEEEDLSLENYPQHTDTAFHPETRSGATRENPSRAHRMSSKMLINIEQLIHMVQERPELYDPKVPSYADRYKKRKAWDDIGAILVPDWQLCGDRERNMKVKEVQTRWRSLKDCFRRELTLQKKLERSGIPANRRRKYVHYEDLLFLEPTMKIRDNVRNNTVAANKEAAELPQQPVSSGQVAASPIKLPALPQPPPSREATPPAPILPRKPPRKNAKKNENEWERQLLSVMGSLRKKTEERNDPDEIFLKNLLPFIKKVPEDRKIDMQLGLMHVVKRFMELKEQPGPDGNAAGVPPQAATPSKRNSGHPGASPQPSFPEYEPCPATRSQAAPSFNHEQDSARPYSSPSSSSSSVHRSPQHRLDSPYYLDL